MTYPAPDEVPYDAWFDLDYKYNPLDTMPIATNENKYAPPELRAELDTEMMLIEQNPKSEEESNWFIDEEDVRRLRKGGSGAYPFLCKRSKQYKQHSRSRQN